MTQASGERILCVDDDADVLAGMCLHLERRYQVVTVTSGQAGVVVLKREPSFAVILSDLRMHGMDGTVFLSQARTLAPHAVRLLLTGYGDWASAIAAVNDGQVFRFLSKPCPPTTLLSVVAAAVEQHHLITAEKVLLEETLNGSIQALVDVLSLANPLCFGRATRLKRLAGELGRKLALPSVWEVEVAAMCSQLGYVALSNETVEKAWRGDGLSPEEEQAVKGLPALSERLLGSIPRLETVRAILKATAYPRRDDSGYRLEPQRAFVLRCAQILCVAADFDALEAKGMSASLAVDAMVERASHYDPTVLDALISIRHEEAVRVETREVSRGALRVGMVIAEDLKLANGTLLVPRGYEVTAGFVERMKLVRSDALKPTLRVLIKHSPQ